MKEGKITKDYEGGKTDDTRFSPGDGRSFSRSPWMSETVQRGILTALGHGMWAEPDRGHCGRQWSPSFRTTGLTCSPVSWSSSKADLMEPGPEPEWELRDRIFTKSLSFPLREQGPERKGKIKTGRGVGKP